MKLAVSQQQSPDQETHADADQAATAGPENAGPSNVAAGISEANGADQLNSGADAAESAENSAEKDEQADRGPLDGGHVEAPYGYKADGTPRLSNAGRRSSTEAVRVEKTKQHARLRSVTPSTHKPDPRKQAIVTAPALAVVNYQAMGEMAAGMFFNVPAMMIGPDWLPDESEGEPLAVAGAFRDYFKATQMRDIPPGFALCLVLTVYTVKRANRPTMRTKLQGVGLWLKHNLRITRKG